MKIKNQRGQALLLVLLSMAVLATMALSVVSRSISDVSVTTREEESLRAFSAAEAGIEEGLITGTQQEVAVATSPIPVPMRELEVQAPSGMSTVSTFTAEIQKYPEDLQQFAYPFELLSGQSASVYFVTRDDNGGIRPCSGGGSAPCFGDSGVTLCWGKPGVGQDPAIVANIIYDNGADFAYASAGYDPDSSRRSVGVGSEPANNYSAPGGSCPGGIAGQDYLHHADINFAALGVAGTPVLMRVSMLYNDNVPHVFGVSTGSALPIQGRRVSSEGSAGEITRHIDAFLLNPEIPFIFDAALYSSQDIVK